MQQMPLVSNFALTKEITMRLFLHFFLTDRFLMVRSENGVNMPIRISCRSGGTFPCREPAAIWTEQNFACGAGLPVSRVAPSIHYLATSSFAARRQGQKAQQQRRSRHPEA